MKQQINFVDDNDFLGRMLLLTGNTMFHDLRNANVDIVTIGQYLQPSKKLLQVKQFITPEQFDKYAQIARDIGFTHVESGPLVRSSYKAHKHVN